MPYSMEEEVLGIYLKPPKFYHLNASHYILRHTAFSIMFKCQNITIKMHVHVQASSAKNKPHKILCYAVIHLQWLSLLVLLS